MRLKQPQFYRAVGVREKAQLQRPRLIPLRKLELPLESIYHYIPTDTVSVGPNPQEPLFEGLGSRLFVEHVVELTNQEGGPRRTVVSPLVIQSEYRRKSRGIRPLRKDEALVINTRSVLIVNYAMLGALYRYIPSYKAEYFRWLNVTKTFWTKVAEIHSRFQWNQYIELQLPEVMPTYTQFKRFEGGISQRTLEMFPNPASLSLTDIWHWLGDDREKSALAVLPDAALEKINFLVRVKGFFFVINLGVIDAWRKDKEDEESTGGIEGSALQRRFVKLLQNLQDLNAGVTEIEINDMAVADNDLDPVETSQKQEQLLPERQEISVAAKVSEIEFPDFDEPKDTLDAPLPIVLEKVLPANTLKAAEKTYSVPEEVKTAAMEKPEEVSADPLTTAIQKRAHDLHEVGLISLKAFERIAAEAGAYKQLPDPYGGSGTLGEVVVLTDEDLQLPDQSQIPDRSTILDKSMLSSKLGSMQRKYVRSVMRKDVMNAVVSVQQQGIAVKEYTVEPFRDAMDHYEKHTVTLKPVRGRQTTISFKLPVVDDDGRFLSNGSLCKMRLQRSDQPIRKVSPSRVALTSYYNKLFVDRSQRKVNDFEGWLVKQLIERAQDESNRMISELRFGNHFDASLMVPRYYALLSKQVTQFTAYGINTATQFYFNYSDRQVFFKTQYDLDITDYEQPGQVMVGVRRFEDTQAIRPVLIDDNNTLYMHTGKELDVLGSFMDVVGFTLEGAPLEIAEMTISNKVLPVGFVLAYQMGLNPLIELLGCEVARYRRGERIGIQAEEYSLTFQDEVLVFSRLDSRSALILAGLGRYHQTLKSYSVWDFDRRDVYYRLLDEVGLGVRFLREIEALFDAWMDPITKGILAEMGEPTTFRELLLRAVELLLTEHSPSEVDGAFMRYRGYERFAGVVYGELQRAAKMFNSRINVGENGVELNPHAVWQKIVQDPSVDLVKESNPIQDLREQEAMTYRGDGGRSGKSMVERTRVYHDSDVGVVSESTVDSGDVGVVAYLSPDANFTNLRGFTRRFDKEQDGSTKLVSTSALLAPAADRDDPKRINFIAVQQAQGIAADGYEPMPLRTGYEQVVAHRTSKLFASTAERKGVVTALDDQVLVVTYDDKSEMRYQLGKRQGTSAGVNYPHELVTDFKLGDKVKAGDVLVYNRKFFAADPANPGQVLLRMGILCRTALIDNIDTLEDGSVISERVATLLNTQLTEVRNIEVRFDQSIRNLVKVGESVGLDSILCAIEDPELTDHPAFDEVSLDTLRRISAMTPRAKVEGVITGIECFYHGDFDDLSDNLQQIVRESDRERRKRAKALGEMYFSGQVGTNFRIKGNALDPDTVAIRISIEHHVGAGVGDKGVFGNQMKTVFSRVMTGTNTTETGEPLDAVFGNTSIEERMVHSPKIIGTTNTLLRVLSKHIVDVYRGTANVKSQSQS